MKKLITAFIVCAGITACDSDVYLDYKDYRALDASKTKFDTWFSNAHLPRSAKDIHISRSRENDYGMVRFKYNKRDKLTELDACSKPKKTKHFDEYRCSYKNNNILIQVRGGFGKITSSLKHPRIINKG